MHHLLSLAKLLLLFSCLIVLVFSSLFLPYAAVFSPLVYRHLASKHLQLPVFLWNSAILLLQLSLLLLLQL
uniref:Uncharacterized protein n=1 Tax=Panstrongylus lignarius TaxID=156445 RepID=A0A224XXS5_9HEMI